MCTRHPDQVSFAFYAIPIFCIPRLLVTIEKQFLYVEMRRDKSHWGAFTEKLVSWFTLNGGGLTKALYFPGGRPASMRNFKFIVHLFRYRHDLHYNVLS